MEYLRFLSYSILKRKFDRSKVKRQKSKSKRQYLTVKAETARLPTFFFILFVLIAISVKAQTDSLQEKFTIFLVGDAGEPNDGRRDKNFDLLRANLQMADSNSCIIFLGDNVYSKGMPPEGAAGRIDAEDHINAQIQLRTNYRGDLYFIPGNHDWRQGRKDGPERIKNQYQYIQSLELSKVHFTPPGGCPGPEKIFLTTDILLVVMDSQWWLQQHRKPGADENCKCKNKEQVQAMLKDIIDSNHYKIILFATHHPFKSYGKHGGYFTWKQHIFPLTDAKKWLYIPLPVIGSLYPFLRRTFPSLQDVRNRIYQKMVTSIDTILSTHPACIHISGHEHNLQFIRQDSAAYIISGSGCKTTDVKKRGSSLFAAAKTGYARIDVMPDGKILLQYFSPEQTDPSRALFSTGLKSLRVIKPVLK